MYAYIEYFTPTNYPYGVNVYTLTSNNYDAFVNCTQFSALEKFTLIEELSWENATYGLARHDVSSLVEPNDTIYVVLDNHHCDSNDEIETVGFGWQVHWYDEEYESDVSNIPK